ncbi:hypothetical protein DSM101010T_12270 [Desulfovibrio subterraneus]|uniref:Uncharacterized protein n=1 Tax=Desulfovibrio subterraneus TaxID=2718620 RepID=A0A7J0BI22_9BACT|nr:hypothetical protein DSM101010T_12270 [Desulfovibrio subterraneus]
MPYAAEQLPCNRRKTDSGPKLPAETNGSPTRPASRVARSFLKPLQKTPHRYCNFLRTPFSGRYGSVICHNAQAFLLRQQSSQLFQKGSFCGIIKILQTRDQFRRSDNPTSGYRQAGRRHA